MLIFTLLCLTNRNVKYLITPVLPKLSHTFKLLAYSAMHDVLLH